jgi:hypothetical protein
MDSAQFAAWMFLQPQAIIDAVHDKLRRPKSLMPYAYAPVLAPVFLRLSTQEVDKLRDFLGIEIARNSSLAAAPFQLMSSSSSVVLMDKKGTDLSALPSPLRIVMETTAETLASHIQQKAENCGQFVKALKNPLPTKLGNRQDKDLRLRITRLHTWTADLRSHLALHSLECILYALPLAVNDPAVVLFPAPDAVITHAWELAQLLPHDEGRSKCLLPVPKGLYTSRRHSYYCSVRCAFSRCFRV